MIEVAEKELHMRERAALQLTGIPAQQNQTAIDRLYDRLTTLHIQQFDRLTSGPTCATLGFAG